MWKLTIEDDEGKQTSLPLAQDEYGIGREAANSVRLTDRNVSRKHAVLKKNGQGWVLSDLQSYNGTYVNGVRVVGEQLLRSGDIVQLGDYRVEVLDEATVAPTEAGAPAAVAPVHQRPNRMVVVIGPQPGLEFPLDKDNFTIGRSEEATISINHASVSRVHAELIGIGNGRYEVVDKGSANGVRINGVELKRGILEAGDALELGDVRLRFVGAGKIFRAGGDFSQQLHPAVQLDGTPTTSGVVKPNFTKLVFAALAVGLVVIILAVVLVVRGGGSVEQVATAKTASAGKGDAFKGITIAKEKLAQKDFEGAHMRLLELVPEGSPAREDPGFKEVEDAWADFQFAKVEEAGTAPEKRKILKRIAATPSVEPARRKKAADVLQAVDAAEPPPPEERGPAPGGGGPRAAPGEKGGPTAAGPTATEKEAPAAPPPAAESGGAAEEDKVRRALEPKVYSGRATEGEIKMLRAICSHLGNRQCRDRANEMLMKKKGGN